MRNVSYFCFDTGADMRDFESYKKKLHSSRIKSLQKIIRERKTSDGNSMIIALIISFLHLYAHQNYRTEYELRTA